MKKRAKIAFWVLAAIIVSGIAAASALKPMDVPVVRVVPKEAYVYFIEEGTVVEGKDFFVLPEVSGKILETKVKKGDLVDEGQELVIIDAYDYMRQKNAHMANIDAYKAQITTVIASERDIIDSYGASINELNAKLTEIEAMRKQAEAGRLLAPTVDEQKKLLELTIEKSKQDLSVLTEHFNKQAMLYENGVISKAEYDTAKSDVDDAQMALRRYETEYGQVSQRNDEQKAESDLLYYESLKNSVTLQIEGLAKNMEKSYSEGQVEYYNALIKAENYAINDIDYYIGQCVITAPISGYVSDIPVEGMSAINKGQTAVVIKTVGDSKIETYVSTRDINTVKEGDTVELVQAGRDKDALFSGTITEIASWAEERTTALGLSEKRVQVTIETDTALMRGFDLDVRFSVYRENDKLLVPTSAIYSHDGKDYVFTVAEGRSVAVEVSAGVKTLTETVIESGIKADDIVIIEANTEGLTEGQRVKPV